MKPLREYMNDNLESRHKFKYEEIFLKLNYGVLYVLNGKFKKKMNAINFAKDVLTPFYSFSESDTASSRLQVMSYTLL